MRPPGVVVGDEGVAEGLQLGQRGGLAGLGTEPFLQCLLEPFHLAAGGGMVRLGVFLHDTEPAQFGLEAVDGVPARRSASEPGGEHHPVVRQHRDRNPLVSGGLSEGGHYSRAGHGLVASDA